MKRFGFFLIFLFMISCNKNADEIPPWKQFSTDELNHTYYGKNTLTYNGFEINFQRKIQFLLNDSDTIEVNASTKFYPDFYIYGHQKIPKPPYANVESLINFDFNTGFDLVYTNLSNKVWTNVIDTSIYTYGISSHSYMRFYVGAYGELNFGKLFNNEQLSKFKLDTALVLNKLYNDVYKFYLPLNNLTKIKLIYYAKKFGYIKIEKLDGTKIELINTEII